MLSSSVHNPKREHFVNEPIDPVMAQCESFLKKGDWAVHKTGGWSHADDEKSFTQLGRVVSSSLDANGKDRITRIEAVLSVEPLHYLVLPTDELEKVQLFDEPRRRGEAAKYAKPFVDDINKSVNMWFAASYFYKLHGIEKPDVLYAFTDFNKKFMGKAKRMSKAQDMEPSPPATSGKRKRKDVNYASVGGTDPCPVCDRDRDSAHEDKTICDNCGR